MPTIELVSIGCDTAPDFSGYGTFKAIAEVGMLKSHRGIFQETFDKERGVIVHLGNNSLPDKPGPWFADELIDWKIVDAIAPVGSEVTKPCIFRNSEHQASPTTLAQGNSFESSRGLLPWGRLQPSV